MAPQRRAKTWKAWTQKEEDRLETLLLEGTTRAQIATALGRTQAAVNVRAWELGLRKASTRLARWVRLLTVPHTVAEVAQLLGVKPDTVVQITWRLRQEGHDIPRALHDNPPWTAAQKRQLVKMAAAGQSYRSMALVFGRTTQAVAAKLCRLRKGTAHE